MTRTVEVTLYQFAELSDKAKERARQWWRDCENETFGHEFPNFAHETFETAAKLLGISAKCATNLPPNAMRLTSALIAIWDGTDERANELPEV